jgi:soluble lytic murein transglycosylase
MARRNGSATGRALTLGVLLAVILVGIPMWRMWMTLKQNRYDALILAAAGENGCDPNLVKAVVWRESKFNSRVRGKAGEIGLMQVMPVVASEWSRARGVKELTPEELANPETNLRVGSWYLAKALQQWSQASEPIPLALAQYNAGRSSVLKWIDPNSLADSEHFISRIQFPTTRAYVRAILQQHKLYRQRGEF